MQVTVHETGDGEAPSPIKALPGDGCRSSSSMTLATSPLPTAICAGKFSPVETLTSLSDEEVCACHSSGSRYDKSPTFGICVEYLCHFGPVGCVLGATVRLAMILLLR